MADPSDMSDASDIDVACGGTVPEGYDQDKPQYREPGQVLEGEGNRRAVIATSCGQITVELFVGEAPITTNSFAFLAGEGFYDATTFHRVVPGFVIQGGDPTGTGTGGPGYRFADELAAARNRGYERGALAMANAGPNTNGSQFFICLDDVPLPPNYTVFGAVRDGMDAVDQIASVPLSGESPTQTVFIESVRLQD